MISHQNFSNVVGYDQYGNPIVNNAQGYGMPNGMGNQNRGSFQDMAYGRAPQKPIITLPSRMMSTIEEVRPNEVPSDGTVALFMQDDYSCIYAKAVNNQGTIDTVRYIPEKKEEPQQPDQNEPGISEMFTKMDSRLDKVDERFDKIEALLKEFTS